MIALTGFLAVILLAMLLAPDTDFARLCHRELVERPAKSLSRFRRHHLLYAVILVPIMLSGGELLAVFGPEFFAAYALELAVYFDAVIVTLALSAYAHAKAVAQRVRHVLRFSRARPRAKRSARKTQRPRRPANDDEDRPAFAVAA